ncbi:outer membrane beta-barrel protein, partial [Reichenbachiella sp.]
YVFTDAMSANLSYDWYFKSSVDGGDFTLSSFNIDYRYYFMTGDTQVYGLAGIGFMKGKFEVDGGGSTSSTETGLNIGVGAIFPLSDALGINAQLKYQTPKFQNFSGDESANIAINAGVVYTFGN